ncbi:MAG: hypothetical protein ACK6D3_21625 [Planctomycetaceae bacterium]
MSRSRNIKPGFFKNEDLAECSPLARLLFVGLWCEADRDGRLEDRPKRIKVELLPYDDCDVDRLLGELVTRGFIVRYEAEGKACICIPAFLKHQNPHKKEAESVLPAVPDEWLCRAMPDQAREIPGQAREIPERVLLIPDSGFLIPDSLIKGEGDLSVTRAPKGSRFAPPTPEEVRAHCMETGQHIDAERFIDYYTANGWRVGKSPMKSWKAAASGWWRRDQENKPARATGTRARSLADDLTDRSWV